MARLTKTRLREMVAELLRLKLSVDRYKALEKDVKAAMVKLKVEEVTVDKGRVFTSISETVKIGLAAANDVLGTNMAEKMTQVKKSISTSLVRAFLKAGEISQPEFDELLERAEKKESVRLHIRPLK